MAVPPVHALRTTTFPAGHTQDKAHLPAATVQICSCHVLQCVCASCRVFWLCCSQETRLHAIAWPMHAARCDRRRLRNLSAQRLGGRRLQTWLTASPVMVVPGQVLVDPCAVNDYMNSPNRYAIVRIAVCVWLSGSASCLP